MSNATANCPRSYLSYSQWGDSLVISYMHHAHLWPEFRVRFLFIRLMKRACRIGNSISRSLWGGSHQGGGDYKHGSLRNDSFVLFSRIHFFPHQTAHCNVAHMATFEALPVLVDSSLKVAAILAFPVSLSTVLTQVFSLFAFVTRPGFLARCHHQRLRGDVILLLNSHLLCIQFSHSIVEPTLDAHYWLSCYLVLWRKSLYEYTLLLNIWIHVPSCLKFSYQVLKSVGIYHHPFTFLQLEALQLC